MKGIPYNMPIMVDKSINYDLLLDQLINLGYKVEEYPNDFYITEYNKKE